jgi:glycosyltransferase involved in cell wall biosynthesis
MSSISIVIPVYNVRPYIDRCVASVLDQTYSDFEAVFIDDCSTDGAMSVVRHFARNDSRIVILKHERNRGLAAARNTGVARAKSEYLTFVDSDDFIAPNLLETMIRASDRGRFDIVETGVEAIDENDGLLWRYEPESKQIDDLSNHPDAILTIQEWGVTQKLWKTSAFRDKIVFPERAFWEDIAVVPSLVADARSLVKVPFVGYSYLQRSDSISNTKSVKHVLDMFRAFERYRKYLVERGIFESYRSTFTQVVRNGASYQISQFRQAEAQSSGSAAILVGLCEVLLDEYLTGRVVMERLGETQFEAIVRGPTPGANPQTADFSREFRSTIRACSELNSVR